VDPINCGKYLSHLSCYQLVKEMELYGFTYVHASWNVLCASWNVLCVSYICCNTTESVAVIQLVACRYFVGGCQCFGRTCCFHLQCRSSSNSSLDIGLPLPLPVHFCVPCTRLRVLSAREATLCACRAKISCQR
jgi:hypothetical protein